MIRPLCIGLISAIVIGTVTHAQGFNVRTGTWEFSVVMQGDIPMDGIPDSMRAQMEAELRKPRVYNSCVTAEDLKTLNLGKTDDSDDENCKVVTSNMTVTGGDIVRQCTGDEPRTETVHFEAPTPESLRANISSKSPQGTMTMALTGKWVSAQCKE